MTDELFCRATETATLRLPESTYRLQFHAGFTFRDAAQIVPYLRRPRRHHLYASPVPAGPARQHPRVRHHRPRRAQPGDRHRGGLRRLRRAHCRKHGLGQILDIVPNHMGVATNDNAWWNDVLENGPASRYADYFDIAWKAGRPGLSCTTSVLLPSARRALRRSAGVRAAQARLRGRGVRRFTTTTAASRSSPRSYGLDPWPPGCEELEKRLGADSPDLPSTRAS